MDHLMYTVGELRELAGERVGGATDAYSELLRRQRLLTSCVSNVAKDPEDKEEKKRLKTNNHYVASTLAKNESSDPKDTTVDHAKRLREVMQI